jgi:hypothetical protein
MAGSDFRTAHRGRLPVTVARPRRIFTRFRGHEGIMVWCLTDPCQQSLETGWFLDFLRTEFALIPKWSL